MKMSLDGFKLNNKANFINPQDLLVEQVYQNYQEPDQLDQLNELVTPLGYNGYDQDYKEPGLDNNNDEGEEEDKDSGEFQQNDFHIGAGVYLDLDKGEESDCEEEEEGKKKKFWFLPFSVDQSVMVDANSVVSKATKDSHGLFSYNPQGGKVTGASLNHEQIRMVQQAFNENLGPEKSSNLTIDKYIPFVQYSDQEDDQGEIENSSNHMTIPIVVSIGILIMNLFIQSL